VDGAPPVGQEAVTRAAIIDPSLGPYPLAFRDRMWTRLARSAGHALYRSRVYMDDLRMWNASGVRYGAGFGPAGALALDLRARWWAKWLWFV
jgi:hypothetical protein